jgi:hypothetical protein
LLMNIFLLVDLDSILMPSSESRKVNNCKRIFSVELTIK